MSVKFALVCFVALALLCPQLFADSLLPRCGNTGPMETAGAGYPGEDFQGQQQSVTLGFLQVVCTEAPDTRKGVAHRRFGSPLLVAALVNDSVEPGLSLPSGEFRTKKAASFELGNASPGFSAFHAPGPASEFSIEGVDGAANAFTFASFGGPFLRGWDSWNDGKNNEFRFSEGEAAYGFKTHPRFDGPSKFDLPGKPGNEDGSDPVQPVPEPGSLLLLSSGLASVGVFSRKRKGSRKGRVSGNSETVL